MKTNAGSGRSALRLIPEVLLGSTPAPATNCQCGMCRYDTFDARGHVEPESPVMTWARRWHPISRGTLEALMYPEDGDCTVPGCFVCSGKSGGALT